MARIVRYQGAIVRDGHLLLIQHTPHNSERGFWLFPGGGIEPGETEEACVVREMQEETCLTVRIERLLLEEPVTHTQAVYQQRKTYLCSVVSGEAAPGYEPEEEASAAYGITAVCWVDLSNPDGWPPEVKADGITYPQLLSVRSALGYG